MSDMMGGGGSPITPDWQSYISQGGDLWNQAMSQVHPSAAVINQVAQMQNQMGNQAFNQGLTGSTLYGQALASGQTQAFDKDAMAQAEQMLGLGRQVGATDIASQVAQARRKEATSPMGILGSVLGMFGGAGGLSGIESLF